MASEKEIGKLLKRCGEFEIEWTIQDIFSYSVEDKCYHSPHFSVLDSQWCIVIYPNGETRNKTVGWISLILCRQHKCISPTSAEFTFGVKKVDGTAEVKADACWIFDEELPLYKCYTFLKRSELLRRKSELAPSDVLTITCILRVNGSLKSSSRQDTLSENLKELFVSQKGCDMTLKAKHKKFSVHKSILIARSPLFADMFKDKKKKKVGNVSEVDCDPELFRDFLLYLYSDKIENISKNAFELYRMAHKYDVKGLKKTCVLYILDNLSLENVCDAAILAHQCSDLGLKVKTQKFFNENFSKIFYTSKWELLMKKNYCVGNNLLKNMAASMKIEWP